MALQIPRSLDPPRRESVVSSLSEESRIRRAAPVTSGIGEPVSRRSDGTSRAGVGPPAFANLPAWSGGETIPVTPDVTFYQRHGKRMIDFTLSGLALLALLPILTVIAIAIKVEDGGPIFYRSMRVGRGGRRFCFWKFRSMIRNAEASRDRLQNLNESDGPVFKIENDPRITRMGRLLRRTSMDELPQFWNVLCGDMSLVGPRPPIAEEVVKYEPWQLRRLSVRPGLTCLWQISGRCRIGFDEWMRLDMEYVDRRSFALDMHILARTVPAVLSGEGAY